MGVQTICFYFLLTAASPECEPRTHQVVYDPRNVSVVYRGVRYYIDKRNVELTKLIDYNTNTTTIQVDSDVIFRDSF